MKKISTPLYSLLLLMNLVLLVKTNAQDVGIGTLTPDHTLHVSSNSSTLFKLDNTTSLNTGIMSEMYFKTGSHYTGALKTIGNGTVTARLGFFTYAVTNPTSLLERMSIMDDGKVGIGTNSPGFLLDINGRMRVRHGGGGTAGIALMDAANTNNAAFVGMKSDDEVGFYGYDGGGWGLTMNTTTGDVSILGSRLYVTSGDPFYTASFTNTSGDGDPAVFAEADNVAGMGVGVHSEGGETGLYAIANKSGGSNHRYGVECFGQNGPANNYGLYASGAGGNNAYGIYATAFNGTTNWAGYFSGSVYTTGSYQSSDRKLKSSIQPLQNAVELIKALKPSTYTYKTDEYKQMELPDGIQYGLVADEVKQIFPSMVKTAIQPAKYENDDRSSGSVVAEEVSFEAVNYTGMIPVLIAAMQEQQAMIEAQQKKIEELESRMK